MGLTEDIAQTLVYHICVRKYNRSNTHSQKHGRLYKDKQRRLNNKTGSENEMKINSQHFQKRRLTRQKRILIPLKSKTIQHGT